MIRRIVALVALSASLLSLSVGVRSPGASVEAATSGEPPARVVVVEVKGPLDQRALDYLVDAIDTPAAQLVVLQVNSPGISSGDTERLFEVLEDPPVPVAAWIGPQPAVALGGAGLIVAGIDLAGAAPGTEWGLFAPVVHRSGRSIVPDLEGPLAGLETSSVEITEESSLPLVVQPTIGQFIASLDGVEVTGSFGTRTLETVEEVRQDDGTMVTQPSTVVEFVKPDLFTRFLRLASRPEATFFYLLVGISAAAFEFYAAGVGITAAVAALSLFLAGYGLATLPMNWAALVAVLLGMALNTGDFQRNQIASRTLVGTVLLIAGGLFFTTADPQFSPRWWAVLLTVGGIGLFYGFALTTIVRSRFSTRTIGREYLVGMSGVAETSFDPDGVVAVDGARWRARSHRAAGIAPGDPIEVREVRGVILEVEPLGAPATNTPSVRE